MTRLRCLAKTPRLKPSARAALLHSNLARKPASNKPHGQEVRQLTLRPAISQLAARPYLFISMRRARSALLAVLHLLPALSRSPRPERSGAVAAIGATRSV